ncbi:MAG UNVERIFIED_CONTAM: hypothetical protein LVR29_03240 [Microcystis novacekii LVE1205-3]
MTWQSNYLRPQSKKPSNGSTIFGILDNILYRNGDLRRINPLVPFIPFLTPLLSV